MATLVLAVVQVGSDADPAPALATLAAARRVLVRPPAQAALPVPPGVELAIVPDGDRAAIARHVRRSADELVVVMQDDERPSSELVLALTSRAADGAPGAFSADRRVRFLGREIRTEAVTLAWRGAGEAGAALRLPGAMVTLAEDVATIIERLQSLALRTPRAGRVGLGDFVVRPLSAVCRRLWRRRRDGAPGVVLSILETYGEVLRAAQAWEREGAVVLRAARQRGVPAGFHDWRTPWGWLVLRNGSGPALREAVLEATPERSAGAPLPGGRGTVWALALGGHERGVLRWYRRGGAVRHLLRDQYFGWPPRPMVELSVTEEVRRRGVAVPEVLAARVDRLRFGWYRGAIVTRELTGAATLAEVLRRHSDGGARTEALAAVGRAVRHLHERGVHHRDLNAGNIMLTRDDALTVWFIDFDRAVVRGRVGRWLRVRALRRLERSLAKLARAGMPLAADDLALLRRAYDEAGGPAAEGRR